jgi:predicted PurR-regulated permease PerM
VFFNTKFLPSLQSASDSVVTWMFSLGLGLSGLLGQLANLFIIPITMLYILIDFNHIKHWVKNLFPAHRQALASKIYGRIDSILSAYLRGAITIAIVNTTVVSLLFTITGVPFAIVLGLLSGLFSLIPQFGILISIVVISVINLFGPSPGPHILVCIVILLGENTLEASVLYPKIVGSSLGLHPVALIASLFVFAYFLGFIGMLLAVPVTSLLARFLEDYLEYRDSLLPVEETRPE